MSKLTKNLITGATGNIGGLVVERLLARGERPRVFVRDADKAKARWGDRVDIAAGDFGDANSLRAALEGVDTLFLLTSHEHIAELDASAADAAKDAGTRHVVKLSSIDASEGIGTGVWHARGEEAIRARGLQYTFVRSTGFMSNVLYWAHGIKAAGVVRSLTGDGKVPFVHPHDVADVLIAALDGKHIGEILPLTGPQALSYAEATSVLGAALGVTLRWEPEDEATMREKLRSWGQSPAMVDALISVDRGIAAGRLAHVEPTVHRVLGRPPRDFPSWVHENLAAFLQVGVRAGDKPLRLSTSK
ncbi:NAD(P)H-binding protein [Sorangium sp. So ce363]|uniref:NAD(P)H-binding protein n=1 Tax=Sorangium sp. So ce363 TaxID=3133304 RepID=UPI003F5FD256